ncbi:hypothetical protein [Neptuniibacter sp. QD37_11]|uniref:hypothetical protein n=1 Tax=Neptuniibacter sp. QD37_11 TaxID=3398209 RepID=UPI0039F5820B
MFQYLAKLVLHIAIVIGVGLVNYNFVDPGVLLYNLVLCWVIYEAVLLMLANSVGLSKEPPKSQADCDKFESDVGDAGHFLDKYSSITPVSNFCIPN